MAAAQKANESIQDWPEESREAAQLVIGTYGEPDETTTTQLVWHKAGDWKRVVATKAYYQHDFPAPHIDAVETFVDYMVPTECFTALAEFDGSVVVERTAGEVSARCHDEQANRLALNLMHDIVTGKRTSAEARDYYAKEFADARRKKPTPYMDALRFNPAPGDQGDPDHRVLSDADLKRAEAEGQTKQEAAEAAGSR